MQQLVLQLLKAQIQGTDQMAVETNGEKSEFVVEVRRALQTMQAWQEQIASENEARAQTVAEQAESVRQLQSQRAESDRLFTSQQEEISTLEKYGLWALLRD